MATVAYKRYHDSKAAGDVNRYITDGHGASAPERTNRYISDAHGGESVCVGYNCPEDADAATAYMLTLRSQYERLHPGRHGTKQRKQIVHLQFFLSYAEYEDVPVPIMLEMTDKLLKRTELGEYACRVSPHTNTWRPDDPENPGNKHLHISLCPYSLDGTHKLSMTHSKLWAIQKEWDKLCVEYGYSIITNPKLLADPEYRKWFESVAKSGRVKIHRHAPTAKKRRTYESKLRNQSSADRETAARLDIKSPSTLRLMRELDIRSKEELERHIKGIGRDISELRKDIARQNTILERMGPLLAIIESSEGSYSPSARAALKRFKIESEKDIEDALFRAERARARLERDKQMMAERNREYADLKRALSRAPSTIQVKQPSRSEPFYGRTNYKIQWMFDMMRYQGEEGISSAEDLNIRFEEARAQFNSARTDEEIRAAKERYKRLKFIETGIAIANNPYWSEQPTPKRSLSEQIADASARSRKEKSSRNELDR